MNNFVYKPFLFTSVCLNMTFVPPPPPPPPPAPKKKKKFPILLPQNIAIPQNITTSRPL